MPIQGALGHQASLIQRGVHGSGSGPLAREESENQLNVFNRGSAIPGETNSSYSLRLAKISVGDGALEQKVHQDVERSFLSVARQWLAVSDALPDDSYQVQVGQSRKAHCPHSCQCN
jgi:hypothetical protein